MPVLLNHAHPFLQIYDPSNQEFIRFRAGRLDIEPEDRNYTAVMAEAARNPDIQVIEQVMECGDCDASFTGKLAAANRAKHRKEAHPEAWAKSEGGKVTSREVKGRHGFSCDVCHPAQTFDTEEALRLHDNVFHLAPPELDENGNEIGRIED